MPLASGIRQTVLRICRSPRHTGTAWAAAHSTSRELGWSPFCSDTTRFTGCRCALSLPVSKSTLVCQRSLRFWVFPRPPSLLHFTVPRQKHLKEAWHWLAAVPGRNLGRSREAGDPLSAGLISRGFSQVILNTEPMQAAWSRFQMNQPLTAYGHETFYCIGVCPHCLQPVILNSLTSWIQGWSRVQFKRYEQLQCS